jgi:hypothetical protein
LSNQIKVDSTVTSKLLDSFATVDFDWVRHLDSVWEDSPHDVAELNGAIADEILGELARCNKPEGRSPLGRIVVGQAGSGKTHLVGSLRRKLWQNHGWFVLLDLGGIKEFWTSAALNYLESLQRPYPTGFTQGQEVILRLHQTHAADRSELRTKLEAAFQAEDDSIRELASSTVALLRRDHSQRGQTYRHIIAAFIMHQGRSVDAADEAMNWLQGVEIEGSRLGPVPEPRDVVGGISWLMSLVGPTLLAVDQIDPIVAAQSPILEGGNPDSDEQHTARFIVENLAIGLMGLWDKTLRTITVVTALEASWQLLERYTLAAATDRFVRPPVPLALIPVSDIAERIVASRLNAAYQAHRVSPPYETYPFLREAFTTAVNMLPRELLRRSDEHLRHCRAKKSISELSSFVEAKRREGDGGLEKALDLKFRALVAEAAVERILVPDDLEPWFAKLLLDALDCYVLQANLPDDIDAVIDGDDKQREPALHARLRHIYRAENDREVHHCFRAIPHPHYRAFQARLRAAITASGIDMALRFRHLTVIRREPPPSGVATAKLCAEFKKAGGRFLSLSDGDLRIMAALQKMLADHDQGFETWLKQRKPLCEISLFRDAGLCEQSPPRPDTAKPSTTSKPVDATQHPGSELASTFHTPINAQIPLGRRLIAGEPERPVSLALPNLARHTAILAGSGSGKTVLLRRIIEEAALLGVPAIVLDPNNDLARLGDAWPEQPSDWDDADRANAEAYRRTVETVVWTPGLSGGRPLVLAPLPDFASVRDDPDELQQAITMAVATLGPSAGVQGTKGALKKGVLSHTLAYFAKSSAEGLQAFVRLLSDLPEGISDITNAGKLAGEMADQLKAAIATNPLLGAKGQPLDPGLLFKSASGGKTRISVINFAGLPTDEGKQEFVNQLQMALFAFIKKHPAPAGRALTGLYVMDEAQNFAPSQKSTACKDSTIALAAQARKYGLGMIFATQVPKNIDNKIVSNCTTHFYGKMSAPASIQAVQELIASRGGRGNDIGTLKVGEFYFSSEGSAAPEKLKTLLCLSHHAQNPLSHQEVVKRAHEGGGSADTE